jgi:hypothetical protein
MKITTIKRLQDQFNGKICTVLTIGVNKSNFSDPQFSDFFTGFIETIEEDGIWTRHHLSGCKNFFPMQYIVGLLEEQVIEESNPEYQKVMEEVKKSPPENKPVVQPYDMKNSPYVNPEMLAAMSKQAQKGTMTRKN